MSQHTAQFAAKPRIRVKAGSRPTPTIRRRVYDGRRIRATAAAIGYLFCLWTGARIMFMAGVAVSETAIRFHDILIETMDRTIDDRDSDYEKVFPPEAEKETR